MKGSEIVGLLNASLGHAAEISRFTFIALRDNGIAAQLTPRRWGPTAVGREIIEVLVRQAMRTGKILRSRNGEVNPQNCCFDEADLLVLLSMKRAYPFEHLGVSVIAESRDVLTQNRLLSENSLTPVGLKVAEIVFAAGAAVYEVAKRNHEAVMRTFDELQERQLQPPDPAAVLAAYEAGTISANTLMNSFGIRIDDEIERMLSESDFREHIHLARAERQRYEDSCIRFFIQRDNCSREQAEERVRRCRGEVLVQPRLDRLRQVAGRIMQQIRTGR